MKEQSIAHPNFAGILPISFPDLTRFTEYYTGISKFLQQKFKKQLKSSVI